MKKTLNDIPPFDPAHDNEDKPDLYQHFEDEIDYDPDQGFDDDDEDDFDSRGDAYGEDDDEDEDNMENLEAEDYPEEEDDYGGDDSEGEGEDVDNEDEDADADGDNGGVKAPEQPSSARFSAISQRMLVGRPVTDDPTPTPPPDITMEQVRNAKPMPDFRPGAHRF